jgi:hypothetical protein
MPVDWAGFATWWGRDGIGEERVFGTVCDDGGDEGVNLVKGCVANGLKVSGRGIL